MQIEVLLFVLAQVKKKLPLEMNFFILKRRVNENLTQYYWY